MNASSNVKVLVVYGTRSGATKGTSEEIAKVLQEANFEVKVVNAKEEKIKDISEYGLVVVGSGMAMGNWASEAEDFVKRFHKDLANKKLAIFISSLKPVEEKEGKTARVARIQKVGLDDKILKYQLKPISTGVFGGIIDYNKMNFIIRKSMEIGYKSAASKARIQRSCSLAVYDLRDWDEIHEWAKELAKKSSRITKSK